MNDFLTVRDAGELERRVHKERRRRTQLKLGRQLMLEHEAILAKKNAGILEQINGGKVQYFNKGGFVLTSSRNYTSGDSGFKDALEDVENPVQA